MILPTKRLSQDRSLIYLGAEVLRHVSEPKTVSRIWDELQRNRRKSPNLHAVTYDWFVLTLDLLYSLNVIEYAHGRIRKIKK